MSTLVLGNFDFDYDYFPTQKFTGKITQQHSTYGIQHKPVHTYTDKLLFLNYDLRIKVIIHQLKLFIYFHHAFSLCSLVCL